MYVYIYIYMYIDIHYIYISQIPPPGPPPGSHDHRRLRLGLSVSRSLARASEAVGRTRRHTTQTPRGMPTGVIRPPDGGFEKKVSSKTKRSQIIGVRFTGIGIASSSTAARATSSVVDFVAQTASLRDSSEARRGMLRSGRARLLGSWGPFDRRASAGCVYNNIIVQGNS